VPTSGRGTSKGGRYATREGTDRSASRWGALYESTATVVQRPWGALANGERTQTLNQFAVHASNCLRAQSAPEQAWDAGYAWTEASAAMAGVQLLHPGVAPEGATTAYYAGLVAIRARSRGRDAGPSSDGSSGRTGAVPFGAAIATAELLRARTGAVHGEAVLSSCRAGWKLEEEAVALLGSLPKSASWDICSLAGLFGAAIASAVLLGATVEERWHALGIAGSSTVGTEAALRAGLGAFHLGRAAGNGLVAAVLATGGYTASEDVFGASGGVRTVLSHHVDSGAREMIGAFPLWSPTGTSAESRAAEGIRRHRRAEGSDGGAASGNAIGAAVLRALDGADDAGGGGAGIGRVLDLLRSRLTGAEPRSGAPAIAAGGANVVRSSVSQAQVPAQAEGGDLLEVLARFGVDPDGRLSEPVLHAARRMAVNVFGLAIEGHGAPACTVVRERMGGGSADGPSSVLGSRETTVPWLAALHNGIAGHVQDFDDTHLPTVIHPGAVVVAAAFALGESIDASYGQMIEAVARGSEVALRIGSAICPPQHLQGWHVTGTNARFGAAVAVAWLLGADVEVTRRALAIAATEGAGLQASRGTMTKAFHIGKAASDGLEAVYMAASGFGDDAAMALLEDAGGYFDATSDFSAPERAVANLATSWLTADVALKPYPCGVVSHAIIDASIDLSAEIDHQAIVGIKVRANPIVRRVMGVTKPINGLQSKFSAVHCCAVGLVRGRANLEEFSDRIAHEPAVEHVRDLVAIQDDPGVERDECWLTVQTADGRQRCRHVRHAQGSARNPLSDQMLVQKVDQLCVPAHGAGWGAAMAHWLLNCAPDVTCRTIGSTLRL